MRVSVAVCWAMLASWKVMVQVCFSTLKTNVSVRSVPVLPSAPARLTRSELEESAKEMRFALLVLLSNAGAWRNSSALFSVYELEPLKPSQKKFCREEDCEASVYV